MAHSEQINELMSALAKAQGKMKPAIKDSTNPHFKSNYADLASVWEACREALSENGLAVAQTLDVVSDKQVLVTTLGHVSGQWINSTIMLPITKPGPQEIVSCTTYCRRVSLAAMVGVFQDDDDGERAQASYRNSPTKKIPEIKDEEPPSPLTKEQKKNLDDLVERVNDPAYCLQLEEFCKQQYRVNSVYEINQRQYAAIIKSIEKRVKGSEASNGSSAVA